MYVLLFRRGIQLTRWGPNHRHDDCEYHNFRSHSLHTNTGNSSHRENHLCFHHTAQCSISSPAFVRSRAQLCRLQFSLYSLCQTFLYSCPLVPSSRKFQLIRRILNIATYCMGIYVRCDDMVITAEYRDTVPRLMIPLVVLRLVGFGSRRI